MLTPRDILWVTPLLIGTQITPTPVQNLLMTPPVHNFALQICMHLHYLVPPKSVETCCFSISAHDPLLDACWQKLQLPANWSMFTVMLSQQYFSCNSCKVIPVPLWPAYRCSQAALISFYWIETGTTKGDKISSIALFTKWCKIPTTSSNPAT